MWEPQIPYNICHYDVEFISVQSDLNKLLWFSIHSDSITVLSRSWYFSASFSRNSPPLMEPEGSLPYSQPPPPLITCPKKTDPKHSYPFLFRSILLTYKFTPGFSKDLILPRLNHLITVTVFDEVLWNSSLWDINLTVIRLQTYLIHVVILTTGTPAEAILPVTSCPSPSFNIGRKLRFECQQTTVEYGPCSSHCSSEYKHTILTKRSIGN